MRRLLRNFVSSALALSVVSSVCAPCFDCGVKASAALSDGVKSDNELFSGEVKSANTASAVVAEAISELGASNETDGFVHMNTEKSLYNDVYTFRQTYNGIPVENGYISVIVDNNSYKITHINNNFVSGISLDVNPSVSADYAVEIFKANYSKAVNGKPELLIHSGENNELKLVWHIQTSAPEISGAYIDANNGEIVKINHSSNYTVSYTCNESTPITGQNAFSVNLDYVVGDGYDTVRLHDPVRNIWYVNDLYLIERNMREICEEKKDEAFLLKNTDYFEENYQNVIIDKVSKTELFSDAEKKNWQKQAELNTYGLAHLYQTSKAYDFYYDNFNYQGTDGKNGALFVSYSDKSTGSYAFPYGNVIEFSSSIENDDFERTYEASAIDVVTHEYTHRVSINKVNWGFSNQYGETGALCEAYSDIMGEYSDPLNDWKMGAAMYAEVGDADNDILRNPTLTPIKCDESTYDSMTEDPSFYKTAIVYDEELFKDIACHHGSITITRVAYLMHKFGIPDNISRKIWYTSMDYLPDGNNVATFKDCREAVLKAASQVLDRYKSYTYLQKLQWCYKIKTAFNAVNITEEYDMIGDINLDNTINEDDVADLKKFINGTYSPSSPVGSYYADVNFDGVVNNKDVSALSSKIKKLSILIEPQNAYAKIGSKASAFVSVCGTDLKYQWYVKNPGQTSFSKSSITSAKYEYTMTEAKDGRPVYCEIKDGKGNSVKTKIITFGVPVTITKQPYNATATIGTTILTTVTAKGHALKYQWYVKNPGKTTFTKSSITKATYYYTMTEAKAGREVYCVITDMFGKTVKTKTVTLKSNIRIISGPTNASAKIGKKVSTTITATGTDLKYTWYVRNYGQKGFSVSSITDSTYEYVMTEAKSGRQVYCVITDRFGNSVTTETITFTAK